jgi:hypothetical protein
MKLRSIYVFTHDSIGVGEDGPTHQPIEHAASLRAIPRLTVIRPADANETASAWRVAITRRGPTALLLTRQALPVLAGTDDVAYGGYVLADTEGRPEVILIATGSEFRSPLRRAASWPAAASRPAWSACPRGTSSTRSPGSTGTASFRRRSWRASRSRPAFRRAGRSTRAPSAGWSASRAASAPPRRSGS